MIHEGWKGAGEAEVYRGGGLGTLVCGLRSEFWGSISVYGGEGGGWRGEGEGRGDGVCVRCRRGLGGGERGGGADDLVWGGFDGELAGLAGWIRRRVV